MSVSHIFVSSTTFIEANLLYYHPVEKGCFIYTQNQYNLSTIQEKNRFICLAVGTIDFHLTFK